VTLRKVPGALALGLLASLLAHAALYGREHAAGGNYHGLVLELAAAGLVILISAGLLLGWSGARTALNGSVLAARLAARLPGFIPLLTSTALCYAGIESLETRHADASLLGAGICLTAAAWLVATLCRWFCSIIAATMLLVAGAAFCARTFTWFVARTTTPNRRRIVYTHRRFARPPPTGSFAGA
jgi:hypothetical protein